MPQQPQQQESSTASSSKAGKGKGANSGKAKAVTPQKKQAAQEDADDEDAELGVSPLAKLGLHATEDADDDVDATQGSQRSSGSRRGKRFRPSTKRTSTKKSKALRIYFG